MSDFLSTLEQKYGLPTGLLAAVQKTESGGIANPNTAVSPAGASGAFQFMPATAQQYGVNTADYASSADGAARYLSDLLKSNGGSVKGALASYNWGPGNVQKKGIDAAPTETRNYLQKVSEALPIDINKVQWDAPAQSAQTRPAIDPSKIVWDDASPASAPQVRTVAQQAGDALSAFGHHVMSPLHGAAQLVEHGANAVVQAVAPNSDFARTVQDTVNSDDAALAERERQYQASTPDNVGSYTGAVAGEVVPALLAGGTRLIQGGADVAANVASRLGLGQGATTAAQLGGRSVASSGLGGALAATAPVVTPGNYGQQKAQQVGTGLAVGAIAPSAGDAALAAGRTIGNTARALVDPFTESGQSRVAMNTLLRFANGGPTQVNANPLVPGSLPTLAEATGNAGVAGLQRTMRDIQPNAFMQREADNAAARSAQLEATTGTKADIAAAEQARDTQAQQSLGAVFGNAGPANAAPVVQAIDSILAGPGGQRSAVSSSLNRIRSMVVDPQSGAVQSDPNILYQSVRKEIGDLLDQRMANANPAGLQASRELLAVRDELDNAIDGAAPGFKQYLSDFASASKPISAMEHLQGLNLTDASGNVTLAKVQNALNGIAKQQGKPGVNSAKAISQQQVDELTALRDDLLRQQNLGKGKSVGSATAQNLAIQNVLANALPGKIADIAGSAGPTGLGSAIGTGVGFASGGPIGAAAGATIGGGIGRVAGGLLRGQNEAIQNRLLDLLLDPVAGGTALNGLNGPTQQTVRNALMNRLLPHITPAAVGAGTGIANRPALPQTP